MLKLKYQQVKTKDYGNYRYYLGILSNQEDRRVAFEGYLNTMLIIVILSQAFIMVSFKMI